MVPVTGLKPKLSWPTNHHVGLAISVEIADSQLAAIEKSLQWVRLRGLKRTIAIAQEKF